METVAKGGLTPLLRAAKRGHAYTVQCLVARGASLEAQDSTGRSVRDYAKERPEIQLALKKGKQVSRTLLSKERERDRLHGFVSLLSVDIEKSAVSVKKGYFSAYI